MSRKIWKTPELIVLVRNRPEEAVLEICKGFEIRPPTGNPGEGTLRCEPPGASVNHCKPIGTT